jgi:hypothetical protein
VVAGHLQNRFIVIINNMFRLITCGCGAVKEYFFAKQDLEYRPVASNRHLDGTTAELPVTTCLSADGALPCAARRRLWLFASKNRSANDLVWQKNTP